MRNSKKHIALGLIFSLAVSLCTAGGNDVSVSAAKKLKLSPKKITVQKGKTKKVSVKGATGKKIKWQIKKKSIASIKKSGKYAVKVKGKKKGKTTLICKVKNGKWKTLKCSVQVVNKGNDTSSKDDQTSQDKKESSAPSTATATSGTSVGTDDGKTDAQVSASPTASGDPVETQTSSPEDSGKPAVPTPSSSSTDKPTVPTPSSSSTNKPAVPTASSSSTTKPSATPFVPNEYKSADFENGTDGFAARGSAKLTTVAEGHTGKALSVTGRTANWHGAAFDVTQTMAKGAKYSFSAWVKQSESTAKKIKLSMELKVGTDTTYPAVAEVTCKSGKWTHIEGSYTVPERFDGLLFYFEGPDGTYDFLVDDVVIRQETQGAAAFDPEDLPSLREAYSDIFERFGNVLSYNTSWNNGYQMQSKETMAFVQRQFNSFTLENEMKPDQLLPSWSGTVSVSEAKQLGYVIPATYSETKVAKLNFDNLDKILEISNQYGLQMRAHVLMWHQQTATRFFKVDYDDTKGTVSKEVMDERIKFFVSSVMKHVMKKEEELTGRAGSIVYCWDVTNEYIHRKNDPAATSWMDVYGDLGLRPTYVKLAYQTAYQMLKNYGVENQVPLFYNDYNEYDCADDIVKLVTYINEGEQADICSGIGMQSHITVSYPSLDKYEAAVDQFLATGLQVQVTELDIGIEGSQTEADQAEHYGKLLRMLADKQKNRDTSVNAKGITGVTIWGLYDTLSWRASNNPLLFGSGLNDPKEAFYAVIDAANK